MRRAPPALKPRPRHTSESRCSPRAAAPSPGSTTWENAPTPPAPQLYSASGPTPSRSNPRPARNWSAPEIPGRHWRQPPRPRPNRRASASRSRSASPVDAPSPPRPSSPSPPTGSQSWPPMACPPHEHRAARIAPPPPPEIRAAPFRDRPLTWKPLPVLRPLHEARSAYLPRLAEVQQQMIGGA